MKKPEPGRGARQKFYCVGPPLNCGCDDRHHGHGRHRQGTVFTGMSTFTAVHQCF